MSRPAMIDSNTAQRRKLIDSYAHADDTAAQRALHRAARVVKSVKDGLISISNSPRALAATLAAGAFIGFAAASGAFDLNNSKNELAAMNGQAQTVNAIGQQENSFDKQQLDLLKKAKGYISSVDSRLTKNPDLAKKCTHGDQSKPCQAVRNDLSQSAHIINLVESQSDAFSATGGTVSDKVYVGTEEARVKLKDVNKKFPGMFGPADHKKFDSEMNY